MVQGCPINFRIDGKQYNAVPIGLCGCGPKDKSMAMLLNVHRPNYEQTLYVLAPLEVK
jgi:hypothetical protein